jgi:hypothetical protein
MNVSVSAFAADHVVQPDGSIKYVGDEGMVGNEFLAEGVAPSRIGAPISGMDAARRAHLATGRMVSQPPRYVIRSGRHAPTIGVWEIHLDRPVQVSTADNPASEHRTVVFVDSQKGEILAPSLGQRARLPIAGRAGLADGFTVGWRAGYQTELVPVSTIRR